MEHMGKENHRVNVKWHVFLVIGLAGCANQPSANFAGLMAPHQGECNLSDSSQARVLASLNQRGDDVEFIPNNGVVILEGHIDRAGHILAQSNMPGADHKPFVQVFDGQLAGDHVTGEFATPRCRATVSLLRQ